MNAYLTDRDEVLHPYSWRDGDAVVDGWRLAPKGDAEGERWRLLAHPLPHAMRPLVERLRAQGAPPPMPT